MNNVTFTSSLPPEILDTLEKYATKFKVPKNRIIEKSLVSYFNRLKKAEYAYSFKRAAGDQEVVDMAEEGMEEYLKILGEI